MVKVRQNLWCIVDLNIYLYVCACVCACDCVHSVAQSCPALCGPVDGSPPGSSAHGIFQARILEWVAVSFSRGFTSLSVSKWAFIKYVLDNGLPWWLSG